MQISLFHIEFVTESEVEKKFFGITREVLRILERNGLEESNFSKKI